MRVKDLIHDLTDHLSKHGNSEIAAGTIKNQWPILNPPSHVTIEGRYLIRLTPQALSNEDEQ